MYSKTNILNRREFFREFEEKYFSNAVFISQKGTKKQTYKQIYSYGGNSTRITFQLFFELAKKFLDIPENNLWIGHLFSKTLSILKFPKILLLNL